MHLIGLRQYHKLLDRVVLDLVVVGFTTEAERRVVHVDVEASSANGVSSRAIAIILWYTHLGVR